MEQSNNYESAQRIKHQHSKPKTKETQVMQTMKPQYECTPCGKRHGTSIYFKKSS